MTTSEIWGANVSSSDPMAPRIGARVLEIADVRRARDAPGILRAFNDAAVLSAADVHVARRLTDLVTLTDRSPADLEAVRLGVALAVRAPRQGHVCVDVPTPTCPSTSTPSPGPTRRHGSRRWPPTPSSASAPTPRPT